MKDWNRSPEPPSMMGLPSSYSAAAVISGDWPRTPTSPITNDMTSSSSPSYAKQRTKVDTSLSEMARRVIMQKIHLFHTFGDTPFPVVRPVLEQCQAKKLWALEEASPHLLSNTGSIWKRHCIKEFKDIAQSFHNNTLAEVKDWRALYGERQSAQQEAIDQAAARVKEKYASLEANRVAHRVRVVTGAKPEIRGKAGKSKHIGGPSNLTAGQKLMRDARKQGNARMQMTQGIRKSAPPLLPPDMSPPPSKKKPRMEQSQQVVSNQQQHNQTSKQIPRLLSASPSSVKPRQNNILITKRRIASGIASHTRSY